KLYISGVQAGGTNPGVIVRTDLTGGNCETILTVTSTPTTEMRGLAVDPVANRLYAAADNADEIYYVDLATPGKSGVLTAVTSHSCVVIFLACNKPISMFLGLAPNGTATVTPATGKTGTKLTCTPTWGANDPALFMARAANTTTYTWTLDGTALTDTTAEITATKAGTYECTATGTNPIGSGTAKATAKITAKAKAKTAKPRLTILGGTVVNGMTLVARVRVSMAGTLRLTATQSGAKACTVSSKVAKGVSVLQCPLNAAAQAAVARKATVFHLAGRLTTAKRQVASAAKIVHARLYTSPAVTG
ncbi:MAG: hypothetical protein ACR2JV_04050, partial [Gaiellales bacterium]